MTVRILGFDTHLPPWAAVPIFGIAWGALTWGVWVLLLRWHRTLEEGLGRRRMEALSRALRPPVVALVALAGGKVLVDSDAFHPTFQLYANVALATLLAADAIWASIRFVACLVGILIDARPHFAPLSGSINYIARSAIIAVGVLVWMHGVGIPVETFLTIAGLAGLTLGLALQDTLRNFFAGLYIAIERPLRIGDFITVEGGYEGTVVDIGWRSTRIRTRDNRLVVIGNRRLSEQVIINHSLPQRWIGCAFPLRVPAGADIAAATEKIRDEVTKAMDDLPALRRDPEPWVGARVDAQGIELTVNFHVMDVKDEVPMREALLRRVYDRLRVDGVVPSRV